MPDPFTWSSFPPPHFTPVPLSPFCSSTLVPLPAQLHFFLLCSSLLPPDLSALSHLVSIHFLLLPGTSSALCAALDGSRLLHNVIRGHATSCPTTFRTQSLISVGGDQSFFHRNTKEKRPHPPQSRELASALCARSLREPFAPLLARIHLSPPCAARFVSVESPRSLSILRHPTSSQASAKGPCDHHETHESAFAHPLPFLIEGELPTPRQP